MIILFLEGGIAFDAFLFGLKYSLRIPEKYPYELGIISFSISSRRIIELGARMQGCSRLQKREIEIVMQYNRKFIQI